MIEFKGTYFQSPKAEPIVVLIQFDGVLLHVWHLPEPFHRLLTSDEFHIAGLLGKTRHIIKLPNGGRLETDDTQTFKRLASTYRYIADKDINMLKNNLFFALLGSMAIILGAWWIAKNGFFF